MVKTLQHPTYEERAAKGKTARATMPRQRQGEWSSSQRTLQPLDLLAEQLQKSPRLDDFAGHVADSGEGRWTVEAAIEEGVPAHVLTAALYARFESRGRAEFADKVLSAMRLGFGGHVESKS